MQEGTDVCCWLFTGKSKWAVVLKTVLNVSETKANTLHSYSHLPTAVDNQGAYFCNNRSLLRLGPQK